MTIKLNPRLKTWFMERRDHTRRRTNYLWRKTQIDSSEVFLVFNMCIMAVHRVFWKCHNIEPGAYAGIRAVLGAELLTVSLVALSLLGVCAFMLYTRPIVRKLIDLAIASFFVGHGVVVLITPTPGPSPYYAALFAWIEILSFGGCGLWIMWRQGPKKDTYDASSKLISGRDQGDMGIYSRFVQRGSDHREVYQGSPCRKE